MMIKIGLSLLLGLGVLLEGVGADIVVGTSAAFRGASKGLGIELHRGASAYFAYVNKNGGVQGRMIAMRTYNDGYEPLPAIGNTIRLIEQDHVFLLMNYVGTPTVTRVLPLVKKYHVQGHVLFFPFTGAQPLREAPFGEHVFNLRASYQQETGALVENFLKVKRPRIAVFYQADAYGRSGWDGVRRALAKHGNKIVAEATYRRGAKLQDSMRRQVAIIKKGKPDAVVVVGSYAASAAFVRDARDAGLKVPIANLSFVGSENLLIILRQFSKLYKRDYTQSLINSQVVPSYEDTSLPAVRHYREIMDQYAQDLPKNLADPGYKPFAYSYGSFEGYLNARLIVEILKKMPSLEDRTALKKTVEGMQEVDLGIGQKISFGPQRHQGSDAVYFTTIDKDKIVSMTDWSMWRP